MTTPAVAARWMLDGKTSLLDWLALTSSLGWTARPSRSVASVAITSLAFMLLLVPEPVWNTSIGKWSSSLPAATSSAAAAIASATSAARIPISPLTCAAAALIAPERSDVRGLQALPRDREVLDRALGGGAPLGVVRDADLAHRVVVDAVGAALVRFESAVIGQP